MNTKTKEKIVSVEWVDSMATQGWQNYVMKCDPEESLVCRSIGILKDETSYSIMITTSLSFYGAPMDPLQIPKCAILKYNEFPYEEFF